MKEEIQLKLQQEYFKGNILDIGVSNNGIIYNVYKYFNKEIRDNIELEYINGKEEGKNIEKGIYDSCILFFTLSNIWLKKSKKNLLKDIYEYLNKDGCLYIWDIDKGYNKTFFNKIKIILPENNIKEIQLKDINILKDNSRESISKLIEEDFKIINIEEKEGIYYIKASKKNKE
ncbi:hypothetical protein BD780_002130 [Clostridium tetanomorphum]|uniref:Class I SAM-dependent methyltransferase n=1 Tax=Clostridium tetanomorphum TaxID=1553 RepID=A0A923J0Q8_CLOTT|nr:hypothetical protein [Clostridium tetanomorphum]KAJ51602.1 hypothetical protein CTM_12025 [Clostridium tetanomorphum DSM 665]MBC2396503.1 class I SAM-dependent methyltransferase [Clostridium tetanomorphum]MBP1863827.1 hypothetical protein [Clostridium tetanomorphum]NRS84905.1 hypothetical protein [Clostridium tetanomorphum]NRZ98121.1 hypothetical protein [Clostridium tetanomorphum]